MRARAVLPCAALSCMVLSLALKHSSCPLCFAKWMSFSVALRYHVPVLFPSLLFSVYCVVISRLPSAFGLYDVCCSSCLARVVFRVSPVYWPYRCCLPLPRSQYQRRRGSELPQVPRLAAWRLRGVRAHKRLSQYPSVQATTKRVWDSGGGGMERRCLARAARADGA